MYGLRIRSITLCMGYMYIHLASNPSHSCTPHYARLPPRPSLDMALLAEDAAIAASVPDLGGLETGGCVVHAWDQTLWDKELAFFRAKFSHSDQPQLPEGEIWVGRAYNYENGPHLTLAP